MSVDIYEAARNALQDRPVSDYHSSKTKQTLLKYLFWIFVLTYGEPDLMSAIISLVLSWTT